MEIPVNDPDGLGERKQQERRQHPRTKVRVAIELQSESVEAGHLQRGERNDLRHRPRQATRLHHSRKRSRPGRVCTRLRRHWNVPYRSAVLHSCGHGRGIENSCPIHRRNYKVITAAGHGQSTKLPLESARVDNNTRSTPLASFCSRATTVVPPTTGMPVAESITAPLIADDVPTSPA
jgi:hypothetical protein